MAFVLILPLLIPCAIISNWLYLRRLRSAAEAELCPLCRHPLGIEALLESDKQWDAHVSELRRTHPGVRLRLIRRHHAVCPGCHACLRFVDSAKSFAPLKAHDLIKSRIDDVPSTIGETN